jgi:hypothetical protein
MHETLIIVHSPYLRRELDLPGMHVRNLDR